MRKIILLTLTLIAATFRLWAAASEYGTGRLFDSTSVVSSGYSAFCQDHDGYIWIGTNKGLLRFDGNAYDIYRHDDMHDGSLSDSRILNVFRDVDNRIWVATANGLNLYQPETNNFKTIELPEKNFYGYVESIGQQKDGTLTFIVSGVGLYTIKFEDNEPKAVRHKVGDIDTEINSLTCGSDGKVYLGTRLGKVYCLKKDANITSIQTADDVPVKMLQLESDGNIIVATYNDIYRIKVSDYKASKLQAGEKLWINSMSNSYDGKVYVATSDRGLWQIEQGSDKVVPAKSIYSPFLNLRKANIGAAYSAPDGNLWLGCNYKGVVLIPGHHIPFTYKRLREGLSDFNGGINAMAIWNGNVVTVLDRGKIAVFAPDGSLMMTKELQAERNITSIELAGDDTALLGVAGDGVWSFDLTTGNLKKQIDIPGDYTLIKLAKGKGDDLFIGIHGEGLLRYDMKTGAKSWIKYEPGSTVGFSNPFFTNLQRTSDDKLWISTFSGLACYDLNTDKMIPIDQEPFLNGATYTVVPLDSDSVLVGTTHGLMSFDLKKGVSKTYTTADGLSNNDVRTIAVDNKGGKWIGTTDGISYMSPDGNEIYAYYGGYGLVERVFGHATYSQGDGKMYFGNDMGLTWFDPDQVPTPGFADNAKVSAIFLNGNQLTLSSRSGRHEIISGNPVQPQELYLTSKDNALTLRMSTMDFRDASNVAYRWRLNPKDEWMQTPPGENLIYLPNLDPGNYEFEVCAFENNTMSEPTRIKIHIEAPWYLSIWAKIVYTLVIIALILLGWLAYKRKQDEKITDEKIKFFMDISHDLRSPLTLVLSPLESLMKKESDDEVKKKLKTMHRNVLRMLSLVNQLLDIRKLEKGKMHLHCKPTDVNSFVGELVEMFRPQAEEKKQTISFVGWNETDKIWIDRNNFDKILVNLISNAIKYTPECGEIVVKASEEDDAKLGRCLSVSVTDTGIGLDAKTQARLFERFYRTDSAESQSAKGFGIGLDLCRRLVELHHGSISGTNREDGVKGSVFRVLIPLDEKLYGDEELKSATEHDKALGRSLPLVASGHDSQSYSSSGSASSKYVLFVDDDPEMRSYVAGQLGRLYKVKTASNGVEALKMLEEKIPDLIISDVKMPEMDGLTFLKRLKSNAPTNHIPVILLSSKTSVADRMSGWEKGADAYVDKPFDMEELRMVVGTLIENRQRMKGKYSGSQETEGKIAAPEIKGNDEVLMQRILKEINEHIEDPDFNVERMASEVGVSRAHLHRKMKDLFGMTPSDYIRNIRLKQACELLKRGDIEVTQVAYKIGFTSQSHFSTHFKRYTGFSPSEYKEKNRN